jgi:DNA-binding NarL/FixJ family response regulator
VSEAESLADAARRFHEMRDSEVDRAIVDTVAALILEATGETEVTVRQLEDAATIFRERKTDHLLASAYLQLARCNFVRGAEPAAIHYLRMSFTIADRCDLSYFFWCDLASFSSLIGHALKHNIHVHHVSKMLRIKLMDGNSSEFLPLLDYPDIAVQEHVGRILDGAARDIHTSLCAAEGLLKSCKDAQLHRRILKYISGDLLPLERLVQLRSRHKLTWREVEVFAVYYQHVDDKLIPRESGRRHVAEQLFMSENTLKIHLGNIRRKIGPMPH